MKKQQDWQQAIDKVCRRILEFPYGTVCKHWTIMCLMDELEKAGYPQPDEFVKAIVQADDEKALSLPFFFEKEK